MHLKGNDFLKLLDYTPEQIDYLLRLAAQLKAEKKAGIPHRLCEGKNVALIFEKTSTRTRSSFEVAAHDLGMGSTYLDSTGSQIGKKESIADTARVLSGMFDGIEYRGFGQCIVEELAQYASVPVWNGLTDEFHPTQILADFLTIREHFGSLENIWFIWETPATTWAIPTWSYARRWACTSRPARPRATSPMRSSSPSVRPSRRRRARRSTFSPTPPRPCRART